MPLFEFECVNKHRFEKYFKRYPECWEDIFKDLKCPVCQTSQIKRIANKVSPPILKGEGFYTTDYKKKGG